MIGILTNKFVLIGMVIALAVATAGGYKIASWQCDAAQLAAVERAIEQAAERQIEIDEIEKAYWEDQIKQNIRWKTVEKEVVKYVQANGDTKCLDDIGVSLWNNANKGASSPKPTTEGN